jgi:hypothetical protein
MGETLGELREAMAAYCANFDPALVPPAQLPKLLGDAGAIEKMAAAVSSMVAARMAAGTGGALPAKKALTERQAAEAVAKATGTSLGEARRAIEAGKAMADQPEVSAAAKAGELSRQQASLVSGAAQANPGATERLLAAARSGSLSELAEEAGRARASAEDLEARRRAVRAARSLRAWTDPFGTWQLHAQGLPEDGAKVMAALQDLADDAFEEARKQGRREAPEAYAFDALVALAGGARAQGGGTDILVRVDHDSLVRGYVVDGETCEVSGFGPLSPQAVLDMMDSEDPFIKAIVTKGKDVIGVAHLGRRPNAYQRSALDWLFPTCAAEGCGVRSSFLQSDHREDWAQTHVTIFDLLDRLCRRHHGLKTNQGWRLVEGKGKRAFVAPDDPRHPGPSPGRGRPSG